jgi:hypothetical protein
MSSAVKEKKPFLPTRKPAAQPGAVVVRSGAQAGARVSPSLGSIALGGEARVHLLPTDVQERKKLRLLKRRLISGVAVAVVLVLAAYGLASATLAGAQNDLAAARTATTQLVTQQSKYSAVTKVQADIASIQASQKTGTAQEILWAKYVAELQALLPAGASITSVNAKIDSPFSSAAAAPAVPLQGPHIATVNLTQSMDQSTIPAWLNSLTTLSGYVDNSLDSVTNAGGTTYTVAVTIHIDESAFSNRFATSGATK